jgi:hypothetical protein
MITKINAVAMISKIKLQQARIKRPGEIETRRDQVKDKTKRYLSSLEGAKSPFVDKVHNQMLSLDHKIISLEELDLILSDYPEAVASEGKLKRRDKEVVLNTTVKALSLYLNGVLVSTFIITDAGIRQFNIKK